MNIIDNVALLSGDMTTPALPAKSPHPEFNPCAGCPRQKETLLLQFGAITMNLATYQTWWQGVIVPGITVAEFRVIATLISRHGNPVSYRELYDALKDRKGFIAGHGSDGYKMNMRSAVKRIRRKFHRLAPEWELIVNHSGFGYAWRKEGA